MTSLIRHTRLATFALILALSLTILPGLISPLVSDEFADWLPGTTEVLADDAEDGNG